MGEQYLDNKSNANRKLDDFLINNLQVSYTRDFNRTVLKGISLNFLVNNLFNVEYEPNGYSYFILFDDGATTSQDNYNYYYPQAGINFLVGLGIRF